MDDWNKCKLFVNRAVGAICNSLFFCIDSINGINKMTINYMDKTLINTFFRGMWQTQMATDLYVVVYIFKNPYQFDFLSLLFLCNYNKFCHCCCWWWWCYITNKFFCTFSLFIYSFLHYALFYYFFFYFSWFCIKSEWVCQRARFYYIHCLATQRAHVIFILSMMMTTFISQIKMKKQKKIVQYFYQYPNDSYVGFSIRQWLICIVFKMNDNVVTHTHL